MKKKSSKSKAKKKTQGRRMEMTSMPMPSYKPEEPKPFSAHFHFEGRTADELHENITKAMSKHMGGNSKTHRKSVSEALSE